MIHKTCNSSDLLAVGTTTVVTGPCFYWGMLGIDKGTGAVTVYDNASAASGTAVGSILLRATTNRTPNTLMRSPVYCVNGLTVTITGTSNGAIIYYTKL